jgi:two-component system NtrC family sensor kinase
MWVKYKLTQFKENFHQRSLVMLESTLEVMLNNLLERMNSPGEKNVQKILNRVALNKNVDHLRIFNRSGKVLFASDTNDIGKNIKIISPHHDDIGSNKVTLLYEDGLYSTLKPIVNEKQCQKCHDNSVDIIAYIDIDTKLTAAEKRFYTGSLHTFYLGIAVIVILFIGFYIIFNRFINNPLKRFIKAMDEVERGNLDTRLPRKREDEFGIIDHRFNNMVANLSKSQKQIEALHFDQLQHADKLVTLGELTAEVAHEINNPAAIILSRSDFLQMEAEDNPVLMKYKDDFKAINNQIEKVSKITGNILKYSRKFSKDFTNVDIVEITNNSLQILDPRITKKNISVLKHFSTDRVITYGDSVQIEQVLINLINNALDAMKNNGMLEISIYKGAEGKIYLKITDDGTGMEAEVVDQIFSPFFTTKDKEKGTGLGLYIVKNIIKNHKAEIKCESTPGKGSTFSITFNEIREV